MFIRNDTVITPAGHDESEVIMNVAMQAYYKKDLELLDKSYEMLLRAYKLGKIDYVQHNAIVCMITHYRSQILQEDMKKKKNKKQIITERFDKFMDENISLMILIMLLIVIFSTVGIIILNFLQFVSK